MVEKVIYVRLYSFHTTNKTLYKSHFGFRKGTYYISTESTIPKLHAFSIAITSFKLHESRSNHLQCIYNLESIYAFISIT